MTNRVDPLIPRTPGSAPGELDEIARLQADLDQLRRQVAQELAVARRIQLSLMPRAVPQPNGWRIATAYRAARDVGGDFYDGYELPNRNGRVGFVVADVTGKGVTAALMMAFTRAVMRAAAYNGTGPADALIRTNRVLVDDARTGLFVTAFVAELDPVSGRLRYASAGHEPPLILRRGAYAPDELSLVPSYPLGAFRDFAAADAEVFLGPGDLLLAYTDGVTDARDGDGVYFGDDRLRAVLRGAVSGADGLIAAILDALDEFVVAEPPTDDVTLLAVEALARR